MASNALIQSNLDNDTANFRARNAALSLTQISRPKNTKRAYERSQKEWRVSYFINWSRFFLIRRRHGAQNAHMTMENLCMNLSWYDFCKTKSWTALLSGKIAKYSLLIQTTRAPTKMIKPSNTILYRDIKRLWLTSGRIKNPGASTIMIILMIIQ